MAKHTHHCDQTADLLSSILEDSKADFIAQSTMARIFEINPPCIQCQEKLFHMQSRLTGRIYAQQLGQFFMEIQSDFYNNVTDMFED